MMILSTLALLAFVFSTVFAAPRATETSRTLTFNPPENLSLPSPRSKIIPQSLTNAQRLREGLPLKAPRRRNGYHYGSSSPDHAYPPVPSNSPGSLSRGFIQVMDSSTGMVVGFVGKSFVISGEYGIVPPSAPQEERLLVNVNGAIGTAQNIETSNGPDDRFPYLGSVLGFGSPSGDLEPGSFSYTYIGGTKQTSPGSQPQALANSFSSATGINREVESAVFTHHPDNSITIHWVNEDPSTGDCSNFIGLIASNILFATGDKDEFTRIFGAVTWVEWKFILTY